MPHLIHTGEGTRVGLGQNETPRLGLQPSYSAHTGWENACKLETHGPFLFDFGGRGWALSEPGGSADARGRRGFRRGSRHAPHSRPPTRTRGQLSPTPGVFLVHIRSPASRRFSGSVKCPLFFFCHKANRLLSLKGGGQNWSAGLSQRARRAGRFPARPPGVPVSGPSALPAPRGSFFPVQPPQSQRPRPRRSREPRALGPLPGSHRLQGHPGQGVSWRGLH